jgi:hypothetical protein
LPVWPTLVVCWLECRYHRCMQYFIQQSKSSPHSHSLSLSFSLLFLFSLFFALSHRHTHTCTHTLQPHISWKNTSITLTYYIPWYVPQAELISSGLPVGMGFDLLPADPSDDVTELLAAHSRGGPNTAPQLSPEESCSPDTWVCWLQGCR